mmetsp:Transcript_41464/g.91086  ORF Transcript_41464/g.91086 Transcript_41464/m.91086 type:complete len:216 (+) Transcript_41464:438-1085(+)
MQPWVIESQVRFGQMRRPQDSLCMEYATKKPQHYFCPFFFLASFCARCVASRCRRPPLSRFSQKGTCSVSLGSSTQPWSTYGRRRSKRSPLSYLPPTPNSPPTPKEGIGSWMPPLGTSSYPRGFTLLAAWRRLNSKRGSFVVSCCHAMPCLKFADSRRRLSSISCKYLVFLPGLRRRARISCCASNARSFASRWASLSPKSPSNKPIAGGAARRC